MKELSFVIATNPFTVSQTLYSSIEQAEQDPLFNKDSAFKIFTNLFNYTTNKLFKITFDSNGEVLSANPFNGMHCKLNEDVIEAENLMMALVMYNTPPLFTDSNTAITTLTALPRTKRHRSARYKPELSELPDMGHVPIYKTIALEMASYMTLGPSGILDKNVDITWEQAVLLPRFVCLELGLTGVSQLNKTTTDTRRNAIHEICQKYMKDSSIIMLPKNLTEYYPIRNSKGN